MTEEEYYQSIKINDHAIYFEEMVRLFQLLGIDPNFSMAGEVVSSGQLALENYAAAPCGDEIAVPQPNEGSRTSGRFSKNR